MRNSMTFSNPLAGMPMMRKQVVIAGIMAIALLAFEMFNFDTTQYALANLLGDVAFFGLRWATILAVAFCAIDFAGLVRFFTPEKGRDEPKEVWYLMGAWLLGATMNALMTWWAISLTLLNHQFGNEVLSREQLLQIVPIFVAVLVWLTRILFIGGITLAGEHLLDDARDTTLRAVDDRKPMLASRRTPSASKPTPPAARAEVQPAPRAVRPHRGEPLPFAKPTPVSQPTAASGAAADEMFQPDPFPDPAPQAAPTPPAAPATRQPQPSRRSSGNRPRQRPPMPPLGQRLPIKARGNNDT